MRASFLRASGVERQQLAPRADAELLAAYFDLSDEQGPLHARSVADAGRRLAEGSPIPAYQINTVSFLRSALTGPVDEAAGDPRAVPAARRSSRWQHLCALLDRWDGLATTDRLAGAAVLSKLGYWQAVQRLLPAGANLDSPDEARMAYLRCNAAVKLDGPAASALGTAQALLSRIAASSALPVPVRLSAAVNLIVHHAKTDRSSTELQSWRALAESLVGQAAAGALTEVQLSVYWRGVSFIPFFQADHGEVARMLDLAELHARLALEQASPENRLLALENLHPLLETRGRAALAAGRHEEAERYYRALVDHDGLDAKVHVRLADFLAGRGRHHEARRSYQDAAILGAPYTSYAHTQAARCSVQLGDQDRAVAALFEAVGSDPDAITPLVLLRDLLPATASRDVLSWVELRLRTTLNQHREAS